MRHVARFAVAVAVLAGCRENSPLQQNPPALTALVFDGAHSGGNKDFFFLPPLAANPVGSPNFDAGKFNPNLSPVVEVCELSANPILVPTTDCNLSKPLVFGPATMSLDNGNEQYQLNWDTKSSVLDAMRFYRITVRGVARGTSLGFLDVDPVIGGLKNVKTGDIYAFQDGRTLPVKARIEQGAFGSGNATDRVEQVVPNIITGGALDVTTNTGFAGARFLSGWLPLGIDKVVVIIERLPVSNGRRETSCLNSGLEELEGCYRFRTDPDLHGLGVDGTDLLFRIPAIAGVCFQIPGAAGSENGPPFALHRREEVRGVLTGPAQELEDVPAPFLRCDGFGATPPSIGAAFRSGRLGDIAKAGLFAVAHAIGRVIQPRALHAVDLGAGGSTNEFSRFGYARTATMTVTSGEGASAPAGSTVPAAVQVRNIHHDVTSAVVGQAVTFTVGAGGGTLSDGTSNCNAASTCTVATDARGTAALSWQLGAGDNTLDAATNNVTASPVVIHATGTSANLAITRFTRSFTDPTVADNIVFTADVQNVGVSPAPASSMTLRVGGENSPPVMPVPALNPGETFTVTRVANLDVARGYSAEAKADVNNAIPETNETDNNSVMSFVVSAVQTILSDASGDATAASGVEVAPDLVSATAKVDGGNLTLQLRFAPGTFDPNATMATVVIDVDQNTATGFPGVDAANNDAASIGAEYNLQVGSQSVGATATLYVFAPGVGFSSQKAGDITYVTDGADVVLPLAALGGDRGEMNFKVLVQTQISFAPDEAAYTGVVDYMTDLGQAPGSLQSHPVVIGLIGH